MKVHDLVQGSPEWLAHRAAGFDGLPFFNASDAPAMMGCSPYKTRAELLREMHTGVVADVDVATQKRFDNGHRAEALARPLAEEFIGEELYPVVGSKGRLSASFDGLTMDEATGFEHKALNDALRAAFTAMDVSQPGDDAASGRMLPVYHRVQMEQQLLVSGAKRILFMASEWTADGELVEERHCWYYPDATLRGEILLGWDQFERDLAAYVKPPATEAAPVGKAPDTLPALRIEVTGAVTASNLAEFKATALGAIRSVNRSLRTDQDFADAEKAVKWCADVESRLKAAKEHALSQTATIDALFKALDDIGAEARTVRLDLDKLVARRKVEVREEAVAAARKALDLHVAVVNAEIAPMRLQPVPADFAGAIKGKRSLDSMQDALDTTLAAAKIAADAQGRAIRANVERFKAMAEGLEFLFADLHLLVHKPADDFGPLVAARVVQHRAAEAAKIEAAEKRAREQEAARIAAQQAEAARVAAAALAQASAPVAAPAPVVPPIAAAVPQPAPIVPPPVASVAAPRADEPATLALGTICERLGFKMSAAFITDALHIKAAGQSQRKTPLYTERQFATICQQLQSHISAMSELYAGETA